MSDPVAGLSANADQVTMTGLIVAHELRVGEIVAGRFRVEELLGVGGMGVVYRAHDLSLDVQVAIKLLRPELARKPEAFERFRNELLLSRQVSSPHVVRIHDIAQHGERWLITMDYIDGESLERRLERDGPLGAEAAIALTRGLLSGLIAAHQRGVVHRDLKPANILFDRNDHPYITDFGIARSLGATGVTQTGLIIGTPEYLSPEQARGDAVDGRSDLYTVGLILYEALSGSLPFAGGTPAETVMRRLVRPPPSLARMRPELPRWLHAFDERLLKLVPAHRFANAEQALRALEQQRVPRPPRSARAVLLAVLAVVSVFGLVELVRRGLPALTPTPVVAQTVPRLAVLPLQVDTADAQLAALARALEEHARQWLRETPGTAVATRERSLAALARAAPDHDADALRRRLPEVAEAAGVRQLLRGTLRSEGGKLVLTLEMDAAAAGAPTRQLQASGADAAALFADYQRQFAAWTDTAAPTLPAAAVAAYGAALQAFDARDPAAAATALQALPPADLAASALLQRSLLQAQAEARQEVSADATRELVRARQTAAADLAGRSALALAQPSTNARVRLLAQALGQHPNDAELILQTAQALAEDGQGERALQQLQALVQADAQDARAWLLLGRIAIQQGQARRAIDDYLLRALVLWTRAGDELAEAETRNAFGVAYERLGQLDAAVEQYTRAADMRARLKDLRGEATSLRNLAVVQAIRGERAAAEASLERARRSLETLGDRASIADLHNDRGVVAEERGDYRAALAAFREALALRQQLDQPTLLAQSLNNVAFCYFQLGETDNAAVYWQQALASFRRIDDREAALQVSQSMGLLEIHRGQYAEAGKRLDASLREAQDLQLAEEADVAQVYRGELALAEGRSADALTAAAAAAAGFQKRADPRGRVEADLLAARAALFLGDADAARAALDAIDPAELGAEQRAQYLLARSRLSDADGAHSAADEQLAAAEKAADDTGSVALHLDARLERARRALREKPAAAAPLVDELVAEAARRGQAPLRLAVIELELRRGLQADAASAVARYREAQSLLRQLGRWSGAARLHALGARALERAGQASEAQAADEAATRARAQLIDAAPLAQRERLAQRLADPAAAEG